jgi:hypothetical protein
LLSSAVYSEATEDRQREVHRRLAAVVADPEEHAWHLALAADVPHRTSLPNSTLDRPRTALTICSRQDGHTDTGRHRTTHEAGVRAWHEKL